EVTRLLVDGLDLTPPASAMTPALITLALPAPLPVGVYAGVRTVQVAQLVPRGDPETPHRGFESNVAAFVLRPKVTNGGPVIPAGNVENLVSSTETVNGTTVALRAGTLKLLLDPHVTRDQRVVLFLNQFDPPAGQRARAYSFGAPAGNGGPHPDPHTGTVRIPVKRGVAGVYPGRVQVDGAEGGPGRQAGKFATPRVDLS